jgi:predicted nucleic acid-binding protein
VRTAIDTNVLSAIWSSEPSAPALLDQIDLALKEGGLVICPAVYSELYAYPGADQSFIDNFLRVSRIEVDWSMQPQIWQMAGERFSEYSERRRHHRVTGPKRFLADFLVGAHALAKAGRLLTLDQQRFRSSFPELKLL